MTKVFFSKNIYSDLELFKGVDPPDFPAEYSKYKTQLKKRIDKSLETLKELQNAIPDIHSGKTNKIDFNFKELVDLFQSNKIFLKYNGDFTYNIKMSRLGFSIYVLIHRTIFPAVCMKLESLENNFILENSMFPSTVGLLICNYFNFQGEEHLTEVLDRLISNSAATAKTIRLILFESFMHSVRTSYFHLMPALIQYNSKFASGLVNGDMIVVENTGRSGLPVIAMFYEILVSIYLGEYREAPESKRVLRSNKLI